MDLTDIYRIFHPVAAQYTFFSAAHRIFSKVYHVLGYKVSLNKYKKIEIILCPIRSQCDKTRNKQQKKLQKIFKYIKTEQYSVEQSSKK
jgi:hypothetical protein